MKLTIITDSFFIIHAYSPFVKREFPTSANFYRKPSAAKGRRVHTHAASFHSLR